MGSSVDVHREGKRNDDTPAPDEAGNRRRLSTPALSATVADASDGAPCCQLAPCIVARHRR